MKNKVNYAFFLNFLGKNRQKSETTSKNPNPQHNSKNAKTLAIPLIKSVKNAPRFGNIMFDKKQERIAQGITKIIINTKGFRMPSLYFV